MKKIFALIVFMKVFSSGADTIPNAGFENWWFAGFSENPAYWETSNSELLAPTVVRDSSPHSGTLAMRLEYHGILTPAAACGFFITSHPSNVGGYIKNQQNTNDSTVVSVILYSNHQATDSGQLVIYGGINPAYSPFIVSISQNSPVADSCFINIISGMHSQSSSITFDDLQFDFSLSIPEDHQSGWQLYPNPFRNELVLKKPMSLVLENIEAFNELGQKKEVLFDRKKDDYYIVRINTFDWQTGVWIVAVNTGDQRKTFKIVKRD